MIEKVVVLHSLNADRCSKYWSLGTVSCWPKRFAIALVLFTVGMLASPSWGQKEHVKLSLPTLEVLSRIVEPLGFKLLLGAGVPETITVKKEDFALPWATALDRAAPGLWKRIGDRVAVFRAEGGNAIPDASPMEYLLEEAPAAQVIPLLLSRHPRVCLVLHRTMNGFYAFGSREDLSAIKRELAEMDRVLPPLESMVLQLHHLPSTEVARQLALWYPEARWQVENKAVRLFGTPTEMAKASRAVAEIDRPPLNQAVSKEELAQARAGSCQLKHSGFDLYRLECPRGDCSGILHKTGLISGDVIYWQSDDWSCWPAASLGQWTKDPQAYQPFWSVNRDGVELNIFLQVK